MVDGGEHLEAREDSTCSRERLQTGEERARSAFVVAFEDPEPAQKGIVVDVAPLKAPISRVRVERGATVQHAVIVEHHQITGAQTALQSEVASRDD